MKKLALTTLAKEDIANCRETGKKRTLKKIAEALEKLTADESDVVKETEISKETANEKEEVVTEPKQAEMVVMYCPVGRKLRIVYIPTPDVVTILALQEKGDIKKK